jgi:para-aminobenzoate synthetase/4-amino-4-deoxychorismate lyase
MEIISTLEDSPRGVYTGAIGFMAPAEAGAVRAQFNVAIRTLTIDREPGRAEYGTGSGIVWESVAADEWLECETKTRVLARSAPSFKLLETLRWDPVGEPGREGGYFLLEEHLRRLEQSAAYFQFDYSAPSARDVLFEFSKALPPMPHRVRFLIDRNGACECHSSPLAVDDAGRVRLELAPAPVDPASVFLYHKTTVRDVYDAAMAACHADDVLLYNTHGELTETCIANACLRINNEWFTPPVSAGLLPGTLRARLLAEGHIKERLLTLDDLSRATAIAVINSVRGWREAELVTPLTAEAHPLADSPR